MSLTKAATGTVENDDLLLLTIENAPGGNLTATVQFRMADANGKDEVEVASWSLSASEKSAIAGLLPGAKRAVKDKLGL